MQKPSERRHRRDRNRYREFEHWWYGTIGKRKAQGWLPRSILLCDGVPTPRGTTGTTYTGSDSLGAHASTGRKCPYATANADRWYVASVQASSPANARPSTKTEQGFSETTPSAPSEGKRLVPQSSSKPLEALSRSGMARSGQSTDAEGNRYYHNTNDDQVRWSEKAQALRRIRDADGNAWSQHSLDGSSTFWFEERTGRVTASPPAAERELKSVKSMNGSDWYEKVDESGQTYWYNKSTGGSSLEMPELWTQESTRRHRREGGNQDAPECIICMDRKCCVMLLPCAHANYCQECAQRLAECPECRAPITHRQRFYVRDGRHTVLKSRICLYLYSLCAHLCAPAQPKLSTCEHGCCSHVTVL